MTARPILYPWAKSPESPSTYRRTQTTQELVATFFNNYFEGTVCLFNGAHITVESPESNVLDASILESRLREAWISTRWKHPAVAFRVTEDKLLECNAEDEVGVQGWAERTVQRVDATGGWQRRVRELSCGPRLPDQNGDCALLYLVLDPEQSAKSIVTKFDLLLHFHHALTDASGFRTIMNNVLGELANPDGPPACSWGPKEALRLPPSVMDIIDMSDETAAKIIEMPKEIELPPAPTPARTRAGIGIVTHTFDKYDFLDNLKASARDHGVKLASTLQAALVATVWGGMDPGKEPFPTVFVGFDLRRINMKTPWSGRNMLVGMGAGQNHLVTPGFALKAYQSTGEFWPIAEDAQRQWKQILEHKDNAAETDANRGICKLAVQAAYDESNGLVAPKLIYVSDLAGEHQLDYSYENGRGTIFNLQHYQVLADEATPRLSTRSHSWNNQLTLTISYSHKYHTEQAVQTVMDGWVRQLESVVC